MYSKTRLRSAVSVLGIVFVLSLCIGLPGAIAEKLRTCDIIDEITGCEDNCDFTTDFRLEDCKFKDKGENPYFILEPGYQLVLEGEEEVEADVEHTTLFVREEITVLHDKKKIDLNGRRINTRVVEEREMQRDSENEEWKTVEISRNYFAICKQTNAVYYFGEWSRDCEEGFSGNDKCADEDNGGSWEAGVDGAMPGLIMPGTILKGAKYFQEIAPDLNPIEEGEPDHALDRGQIEEMGLGWPEVDVDEDEDEDEGDFEFTDCIKIVDTNPVETCGEDAGDEKIYCPGVGLVQDEDLELVGYGKGGEWEGEQEGDNDDDDDDDDDDDHHYKKKRWHRR